MNRKQKNRLIWLICILVALSGAAGLTLYALKQNINLFYTPTGLFKAKIQPNQSIRIGGYVKDHSVVFDSSGTRVNFIVTDRTAELPVEYHGILPNLFREGQTVVVTGKVSGKKMIAQEVLAKHDERYMPKPLAKELEQKAAS